jgi:hypothetical protein
VTDVDRREPAHEISFETGQAWRLVEPGNELTEAAPAGLSHDEVVAALRSLGCEGRRRHGARRRRLRIRPRGGPVLAS